MSQVNPGCSINADLFENPNNNLDKYKYYHDAHDLSKFKDKLVTNKIIRDNNNHAGEDFFG